MHPGLIHGAVRAGLEGRKGGRKCIYEREPVESRRKKEPTYAHEVAAATLQFAKRKEAIVFEECKEGEEWRAGN